MTIKTEEYGLSDYVKETNKGHNRFQKLVEKKNTKMCRLGGEKEETTFHILCHCSKIVATGYKKMHDGVAKIVNWNLTRQYGFKTTKKRYDHQIETVLKNQKSKDIVVYQLTNRPCGAS